MFCNKFIITYYLPYLLFKKVPFELWKAIFLYFFHLEIHSIFFRMVCVLYL